MNQRRDRTRAVSCVNFALLIVSILACTRLSAATYQVGSGQTYTTINGLLGSVTLNPGDLVLVNSGTYNEVVRWTRAGTAANPITIRGVGATRPLIDGTGFNIDGGLPRPRAVFQIEASHIVIENFEFIHGTNGNNGAGIRVTSFSGTTINTVIRNCKITYCDMGMQSDSNDTLLVESCEVAFNGTSLYAGYSHNFYLNGNKTTVRYCYIHDSLYGQNFKTRGHYTELLYNTIANSQDGEIGFVDGAGTTDTANSNAVMIGNVIVCKARDSAWNHTRFIQFGQDGGTAHTGTLYAINNTFYTLDSRINFINVNATGASAVFSNNIFYGSTIILQSGSNAITGATNWMPTGSTIPSGVSGSILGSSPGLVNIGSRDYHPLSTSACVNAATGSPTYADGTGASQSGVPQTEYVNDLSSTSRPTVGSLDIGAYEYVLPLAISTTSVPTGTAGAAYSKTLSATGGVTPYAWSLNSGSLPTGISISSAGVVSGTTSSSGSFNFSAKVTESRGTSATQSYTLNINAALSLAAATLPSGVVGTSYSQSLSLSGGTSPFTWSISAGALPASLGLSSGTLSGTPSAAGTASFTVKVVDAAGAVATQNYSITINAAPLPPSLPATTLPDGTVGAAYSQNLPLNNGTAPFTWSVTVGALPAGLNLNSGTLSGTPNAVYSASFTIKVVDALAKSATQSYSITINTAMSLAAATLPSGTVGTTYSQTVSLSGGTAPFTWSISAGALPGGLNLSAGSISGTPSVAGSASFTVKVVDAAGANATQNYAITIHIANQAPLIGSSPTYSPNPALAGQSIAFTVSASDPDNDALTYAWTFGDGGTGTSATPAHTFAAAGTYSAQVTATDAGGLSAIANVSVTVNAPSDSGGAPGGGTGNPGGAGSNPGGGATPPGDPNGGGTNSSGATSASANPMSITRIQILSKFNTDGHDAAMIQGILPAIARLFDPVGKSFSVNIGSETLTWTLDPRGNARSTHGSAALKFKPSKRNKATRKQEFQGGDVKFAIRIQNVDWTQGLSLDPPASAPLAIDLPVTIQLDGITFAATVSVHGAAKAGHGVKLKN